MIAKISGPDAFPKKTKPYDLCNYVEKSERITNKVSRKEFFKHAQIKESDHGY
jgi:hypothetical protein